MYASAFAVVRTAPARFSQPRTTQRYASRRKTEDEDALTRPIAWPDRMAGMAPASSLHACISRAFVHHKNVEHPGCKRPASAKPSQVPQAIAGSSTFHYPDASLVSKTCLQCGGYPGPPDWGCRYRLLTVIDACTRLGITVHAPFWLTSKDAGNFECVLGSIWETEVFSL